MISTSVKGSSPTFASRISAQWRRFVEPIVDIDDIDRRYEARLLAELCLTILIVAALGITITIPSYTASEQVRLLPICVGIVLFSVPYWQSRQGYVETAITVLALIATLLIALGSMFVGGIVGRDLTYYFILVIIFISVFSTSNRIVFWVAIVVGFILLYQLLNPELPWLETLRGPLSFNAFSAGFIAVFTSFWHTRERNKRQLLEISERKQAQLRIRQERQAILRDFVAAVTHDFRTRLSIIDVNHYLIQKKVRNGAPLQTIVHHFETSKTVIQQMALQMENMSLVMNLGEAIQAAVDLRAIVEGVAQRVRAVAQDRQITLETLDSPTPVLAYCNQKHIEIAVLHLVENALAYTPSAGRVTLSAHCTDTASIITIADTGVGIESKHLARIFDAFYKVDNARTTSRAGLGLGLTIVSMIAESCSGSIEVESTPGSGSIFRLRLPNEPTTQDAEA